MILSDCASIAGSDPRDVFGTWEMRPEDWHGPDGNHWGDADKDEDGRLGEPWSSDAVYVVDAVDLAALRRYASLQQFAWWVIYPTLFPTMKQTSETALLE